MFHEVGQALFMRIFHHGTGMDPDANGYGRNERQGFRDDAHAIGKGPALFFRFEDHVVRQFNTSGDKKTQKPGVQAFAHGY